MQWISGVVTRSLCEKILFVAMSLGVSVPAFAGAGWQMNQLSILMPLPERGAQNLLWAPKTSGRDGIPLSTEVYRVLPQLVTTHDRAWVYENLRVVAMRIDPCFVEGNGPCQKQVRFVWQPVEQVNGKWQTLDAAIHSFHSISDIDWKNLIAELAVLNSKFPSTPDQPLGVQATLKAQGMNGPYGRELFRIIKSYATEKNFTRGTAMAVNDEGTIWVFAGIDLIGGELKSTPIPNINSEVQAFSSSLAGNPEFFARIIPEPRGQKPFLNLLADSARAKQEMASGDLIEAVRRSLVISNPRLSNPGTVDCASCHAARSLPDWGRINFPNWNWSETFDKEIFVGDGNLSNTSVKPHRTNALRSFGYFGSDPMISPRVIHETAMVVEAMNKKSADWLGWPF